MLGIGRVRTMVKTIANAQAQAFEHRGHEIVPEFDAQKSAVVGWRVSALKHTYKRKRDAIRAINRRVLSRNPTDAQVSDFQ